MLKDSLSGHYTLEPVGEFFGCSYVTVSRAENVYDAEM